VRGRALQELLSTPTLRLYRTDDVIGAELGGALKNVIAIAAGTVIGAGLGDSARAALMTGAMPRWCAWPWPLGAGGNAGGPVGVRRPGADLHLGAVAELSALGWRWARAKAFDPAVTVEGVATARPWCAGWADWGSRCR
jgi:glycerol-3-phosphate dehydrogenase (NAD(P)+)